MICISCNYFRACSKKTSNKEVQSAPYKISYIRQARGRGRDFSYILFFFFAFFQRQIC